MIFCFCLIGCVVQEGEESGDGQFNIKVFNREDIEKGIKENIDKLCFFKIMI